MLPVSACISFFFLTVDVDMDPICLLSVRGDFGFVLLTPHASLTLLPAIAKIPQPEKASLEGGDS